MRKSSKGLPDLAEKKEKKRETTYPQDFIQFCGIHIGGRSSCASATTTMIGKVFKGIATKKHVSIFTTVLCLPKKSETAMLYTGPFCAVFVVGVRKEKRSDWNCFCGLRTAT